MTGLPALEPDRDAVLDVAALEAPVQSLAVWSGCVHALTRAEAVVVASPPFQRLRRLRQMGLAYHAWPNAENTRASHSLGVAYWASAYLGALQQATDPATETALAAAERELEGLSLSIVIRLFALLHDIDLLPLGHTLRYQSGVFSEPAGRPRLKACVAAISDFAQSSAFHDAPGPASRGAWLRAFDRHLHAAAAMLEDEEAPGAALMQALVNSGLGADLVDFALRDSAAIARPQAPPEGLVDALRLVPTERGPALALELGQEPARRIAIADDLFRARFEVFAGSVYHPVKLAADAMLDFVLRRLGAPGARALLPEDRLIAMGDDELLERLVAGEAETAGPRVAAALRDGVLHSEVWRTEDLELFLRRDDAAEALSLSPAWRNAAEARLRSRLPWAEEGDVIVAISAPTMQAKPADARLRAGSEIFTLAEAAARGLAASAAETAAAYRTLWSLRVCLAPRAARHAAAVREAAQPFFAAELALA